MAELATDVLAVDFYTPVIRAINLTVFIFALLIEIWAFGHCLMQKPDAFGAVGTLSKGLWLALTGGGVAITLLLGPIGILGLIGITAAAVYLLGVRPAIRDATDGSGPW